MRVWTCAEVDGGPWYQYRILVDGKAIAANPFVNAEERAETRALFQFVVDACNNMERGDELVFGTEGTARLREIEAQDKRIDDTRSPLAARWTNADLLAAAHMTAGGVTMHPSPLEGQPMSFTDTEKADIHVRILRCHADLITLDQAVQSGAIIMAVLRDIHVGQDIVTLLVQVAAQAGIDEQP